jgi:flagellar biosynthesis/type III secretory pathway M-ring protein FliF/YscJ
MNPFHATICFCAVIVTAIAVYFFWQDQSDRRAYTMSQVEMRAERVNRDLQQMGLLKQP